LSEVEDIVMGKMSRVVRLPDDARARAGASRKLRDCFPGLKVTLQEIDQGGAERLIAQGEADFAITVLTRCFRLAGRE
jgi:hypothetical protein